MKKFSCLSILLLLCIMAGSLSAFAQTEQNPLNYQYYILGNQKVTGTNSATLSDIVYKGFSSSAENVISGQKNSTEKMVYLFNDITTNPKINLKGKELLYWRQEEDGFWVKDSEAGNGIIDHRLDRDACFVLVLDCSSSIGSDFSYVKEAAITFINRVSGVSDLEAGRVNIGIINFSTMDETETFPIIPLTESNRVKMINFINSLENKKDATAMYYALNNGIDIITDYIKENDIDVEDRQHIITFTDGLDNTSQLKDINLYTSSEVDSYILNKISTTHIDEYHAYPLNHSIVCVAGKDIGENMKERMESKLKRLVAGHDGNFIWAKNYYELIEIFSDLAEQLTEKWANLVCTSALNHNGPVCWTYGEPKAEVPQAEPKPQPKPQPKPSTILNKGYRCFIDFGYGFGGDGDSLLEIATTHGYQFNQYLFAGVGIGLTYFTYGDADVPVFANLRGTLPISNTKIAPYADMRIGCYVCYGEFYFNPSAGVRFGVGKDAGISLGIGYDTIGAVILRLGFDF